MSLQVSYNIRKYLIKVLSPSTKGRFYPKNKRKLDYTRTQQPNFVRLKELALYFINQNKYIRSIDLILKF